MVRGLLTAVSESLALSLGALKANVLRTFLSLLGVTIGIFCIVSIFTVVDSLELSIRKSLARFGDNVVFVQKWPWGFDSNYPWWEYVNRREVSFSDMRFLEQRVQMGQYFAYGYYIVGQKLEAGPNHVESAVVRAISHDFDKISSFKYLTGRYFTEKESEGAAVAVLGHDLAETLFGVPERAIGQQVNTLGRKVTVVGVLEKEGKGIGVGGNQDKHIFLPLFYASELTLVADPMVAIQAKPGVPLEDLEAEVKGVMRGIRRLTPREKDDFSVNKITLLENITRTIIGFISTTGWIIGGFSMLVGGFGIANIMFVSVKERTSIIGIQKALGAKKYLIQIQFLFESVVLCLMGSTLAILLVALALQGLRAGMDMELTLTLKNVLNGTTLAIVTGVLSGFLPARQAANMDPIEAIRSNG